MPCNIEFFYQMRGQCFPIKPLVLDRQCIFVILNFELAPNQRQKIIQHVKVVIEKLRFHA